jgi:hypothetical protein
MRPGGELYEAVAKEAPHRHLRHPGELPRQRRDICSVFVVTAENGNINSQNRFKDLVLQGRMPFKMPKGRQYQVTHTFDLNDINH